MISIIIMSVSNVPFAGLLRTLQTTREKLNDKVFPGQDSSSGVDQPRVPKEMIKVKEIRVDGRLKYSFILKNLTHFTTYKVGIQACRFIEHTNSTEMENDTTGVTPGHAQI